MRPGEITPDIDLHVFMVTGVSLCFAYQLKAIREFYLRCTVNIAQNDAGHKYREGKCCWHVVFVV